MSSRIAILTPRYQRARTRLGIIPGSQRGRAVGRAIAALLDAEVLPSPLDARALLPPTGDAFVRRVPGRNLWIWYRADAERLFLVHVSSDPPIPSE